MSVNKIQDRCQWPVVAYDLAGVKSHVEALLPDHDAVRWWIWDQFRLARQLVASDEPDPIGMTATGRHLPRDIHEYVTGAVGEYGGWHSQYSGTTCGKCGGEHLESGWYFEDERYGPWMEWHHDGQPYLEVPYRDSEPVVGRYRSFDVHGKLLRELQGSWAELWPSQLFPRD